MTTRASWQNSYEGRLQSYQLQQDGWTRENMLSQGMHMSDRQDWYGMEWLPPFDTRTLRMLGGIRARMIRDTSTPGPETYLLCSDGDGHWYCEVPK